MPEFNTFRGSKTSAITPSKTTKPLNATAVLIKVTHSGLCGTDVHYKSTDMVLGHEGAGTVEKIGDKVTLFKVGDRVGWGYEHHSCGHCKQCLTGFETFCAEREMYGASNFDQGSFATHAVWNEDFVFKIPDEIDSAHAAPLMCGGATVYNAMASNGVKSTDVVGVIGVGGLGHLAIQFAASMGCEVVVFSGTDSKKDEATRLGASKFYAAKGVKDLTTVCKERMDHLFVTTAQQPDWDLYLPVMEKRGTIHPLTVSEGDLKIPYMPILEMGLRVQGNLVAARQVHKDMLAFSARHGVKPIIEEFKLDKKGIEQAFDKLESGKMRYRGVLVAST